MKDDSFTLRFEVGLAFGDVEIEPEDAVRATDLRLLARDFAREEARRQIPVEITNMDAFLAWAAEVRAAEPAEPATRPL